ncbi:hypothetical protein [Spirosoma knui]
MHEQMVGTWIGIHTEVDLETFCPLPIYLQLDADSTYHLGMVDGSATERLSTWGITNQAFRLDTIRYAPRLVHLHNDLLQLGAYYPMRFRRFQDVPIDSANAYKQLVGRTWQSDSLIVNLYASGQVSLENACTNQRTVHYWRLARFGTSVFLVVSGTLYKRDGGYKLLWQLTDVTTSQFRVISWNGQSVATESFRFVKQIPPGDSCRPNGFQTCVTCFSRMENGFFGSRNEKYNVAQLVRTYYQPVYQPGQSGLVRVRFAINCQGERGLFDVAGFDEDYCPRSFAAQITGQLLKICREHIPADLAVNAADPAAYRPQDSAISLTFRLKDGRLTDILP